MSDRDRPAVFVIDGKRYFVQMWFIPGDGCDWMAALWRDPDGPLELTYRFRYYESDRVWESGDQRSVVHAVMPSADENDAVQKVNLIADALVRAGFRPEGEAGGVHKIPLRTADAKQIGDALKAQEWAHMRTEEA